MTNGEPLALGNGAGTFKDRRAPGAPPKAWARGAAELSRGSLIIADVLALAMAYALVRIFREWIFGPLPPLHWGTWTATVAWFLFRAAGELYSPSGRYPPEGLRRSFRSSAAAFAVHIAILLSTSELQAYRILGLLVWPVVLPFTYAFRTVARSALISRGLYGVPIAVIGNGIAARRAIRELLARPGLGYVPVAVFTSEKTDPGEQAKMLGVPIVGRAEAAERFRFPYRVNHAMLAIGSSWDDERNHRLAQLLSRRYNHLQLFSNLVGDGYWLARACPIGPYLSIETRHARFSWHQRLLKRALDISIALPALILSLPILLLAALGIYIANPGPVFFSQTREGRGGKPIRIYKLRSMVVGAEQKLAQYLVDNPSARIEYDRTMKLRDDPRTVPVIGKIIRKWSIDELPQLWMILKGNMSLVGPRIMPEREVSLYSEQGRQLRRDMLPGLTGFWQVEHRNDSDFRIREIADSFYVANWSVWLDLWIILRTVRVVLTGAGAF